MEAKDSSVLILVLFVLLVVMLVLLGLPLLLHT